MKLLRPVLAAFFALAISALAFAAGNSDTYFGTPGGGGVNGAVGMYINPQGFAVPETNQDPCGVPGISKLSSSVSITTATTTQIVAASGSTAVYICGGVLSIAPSATTADTAQLVYGTDVNCATGTTAITGQFGAGNLTTAVQSLVVPFTSTGVSAVVPSGKSLCLTSAGATVNIQGMISYVQQ